MRFVRLLAALIPFGLAASVVAAPLDPPAPRLEVVGALKVKPYTLVRLKAEGVDPKAAILWRVSPSAGVERATTPKGVLEFVAPPGTYHVETLVIKTNADGGIDVEEKSVTVEIEKPDAPKPDPKQPDPPKPDSPKPDPLAALGRIQFGGAGCTATIIYPRRPDGKWDVLTAAHCVRAVGQRGTMALKDGRKLNVTVTALHPDPDCAWLVTDETFADLPYALIAQENPAVGAKLWHAGYGVDVPGNREDGEVIAGQDANGQIQMAISVSSGDSGGGMFRADTGELISVVCCTTSKGTRARVWGCSPTVAAAKRPKATAEEKPEKWIPTAIPERAESPACCPAK